MTTPVVVLVPRRPDHGRRDQLWAWCRERWPYPITEGASPEGPFNRSAAINAAASAAGEWAVAVIIDSDVYVPPEQLAVAVRMVQAELAGAVLPYSHFILLDRRATDRVLAGDVPTSGRGGIGRTNRWSGCVVVGRGTFDAVGGFDERFVGWGGEDIGFAATLLASGPVLRVPGNTYHLWHPMSTEKSHHREQYRANVALERDYVAALEQQGVDARTLFDDPPNYAGPHPPAARYTMQQLIEREPIARGRDDRVLVVVHTDGRRDYICQAIPSFEQQVRGPIARRVIWDDSADPEYVRWLEAEFPAFEVIGTGRRRGYTRSMRALWQWLSQQPEPWVFRLEDDFMFDQKFDLTEMRRVLEAHPHLRQMALLRGPWYQDEVAAGGIIEANPSAFHPATDGDLLWLEHRTWWTANPSLFRRDLARRYPWPARDRSEWHYSQLVKRDPEARMAYWGPGSPMITHLGAVKVGTGY
jgi:GT2 family glycosyltransferase